MKIREKCPCWDCGETIWFGRRHKLCDEYMKEIRKLREVALDVTKKLEFFMDEIRQDTYEVEKMDRLRKWQV